MRVTFHNKKHRYIRDWYESITAMTEINIKTQILIVRRIYTNHLLSH